MRSLLLSVTVAFGLICIITGCRQSGPTTASVTGTVTCNNEPCHFAQVRFIPRDNPGLSSFGSTDERGRYVLNINRDKKGALIGTHDVEIVSPPPLTQTEIDQYNAAKLPIPKYEPLAKKYAQPGELKAEVKPGSNTIDFKLAKE